VVIISLSKHTSKFPSYHCFQSLRTDYIIFAICSYRHGAENILLLVEHSANVSHTTIRAACLFIRAYSYKIDAGNQLHNCICGALSITMTVL